MVCGLLLSQGVSFPLLVEILMVKRIIKRSPIKTAFGKAVRKLRLEKKLSQEKLAELANLHPNYISSVEKGDRNITLENIYKIAVGLSSHPCALFHRLDDSFGISEY